MDGSHSRFKARPGLNIRVQISVGARASRKKLSLAMRFGLV